MIGRCTATVGRYKKQCLRQKQPGMGFCHSHDPAGKEARKKTGRRSRRKGSTFERQVANDLKPLFEHARCAGLRQTQSGAADAPDVDGCPPLWIETKHGKQTNPRAALAQAEEAMAVWAAKGGDPALYKWALAVCKDDRQTPFCQH